MLNDFFIVLPLSVYVLAPTELDIVYKITAEWPGGPP
jgi:hypothetical protein